MRNSSSLKLLDDANFIFPKSSCSDYKRIRLGDERLARLQRHQDQSMSLAFSILVNEQVEQFERLLVAMYEPTNIYCIHVDAKSSDTIKRAIRSIVDCFDNVFVTTRLERVVYAGFSRLKADINCIRDLLNLTSLVDSHENLMGKRVVNWRFTIFYFLFSHEIRKN